METLYFVLARRMHIVAEPCGRSSHSRPTVSGGGVVFYFALLAFCIASGASYIPLLAGATLLAGVSFADDMRPLGVCVRMAAQIVGVTLAAVQLGAFAQLPLWAVVAAMVVGAGFVNACNFMDGINGITGGYSLLTMLTLWYIDTHIPFISTDFPVIMAMAAAIFCFCNYRRRALCFAGDVGSVTVGYAMLFGLGSLMLATRSVAPLVFVAVYGVDTVLTILHRMMLRQNILRSHRMHLYQLISNEMGAGHLRTSAIYIGVQAIVNAGALWLGVNPYVYLAAVTVILGVIYIVLVRKYFCLCKR